MLLSLQRGGPSASCTRSYQLDPDYIVPSLTAQPLLLLAYNQPDNALLNDEFWRLTLAKRNEVFLREVTTFFEARSEWGRQLEQAALSGLTVHELEDIRRVSISLCAWVIVAEDEIAAVRAIAHALRTCDIHPDFVIAEASQIAQMCSVLFSRKMDRQPFLNR
ncbi:hypothetical protein SB861_49055 [Paraburkholderia sp. SIMBA_049]